MKTFSTFKEMLGEERTGGMPPNILILRRTSIRQFPDHTMVALYYNDKLDQYFSIPYGGDEDSIITPSTLKEGEEERQALAQRFSAHHKDIKDLQAQKATSELNEDAITHLRAVKGFTTSKSLRHKDGKQTKVDPTTASALLAVHDSLSDDNKKKFADHLEKSKPHFHRMVDFAWKNVS